LLEGVIEQFRDAVSHEEFEVEVGVNAVVVLDCFAETATLSINERMLDDLECLFDAHMD
jgi:hypothetical protein